jgi:hypothetical protein
MSVNGGTVLDVILPDATILGVAYAAPRWLSWLKIKSGGFFAMFPNSGDFFTNATILSTANIIRIETTRGGIGGIGNNLKKIITAGGVATLNFHTRHWEAGVGFTIKVIVGDFNFILFGNARYVDRSHGGFRASINLGVALGLLTPMIMGADRAAIATATAGVAAIEVPPAAAAAEVTAAVIESVAVVMRGARALGGDSYAGFGWRVVMSISHTGEVSFTKANHTFSLSELIGWLQLPRVQARATSLGNQQMQQIQRPPPRR